MRSAAAKRMMERYGSKPKSTTGSGVSALLPLIGTAAGFAIGGIEGAQIGGGLGQAAGKLTATGEQAEGMDDGMDAIMKGLEGLAAGEKKKKLLEMMKAGKITPAQATAAAKGMTA